MNIIEFNGYRCMERPLNEWKNYVCKHLTPYVSAPGHDKPTSIVKILQDGSKSSEIFLFIKGLLPVVNQRVESTIKGSHKVITCNTCHINVYGA